MRERTDTMMHDEIKIAINKVFEKTGIIVPEELFKVEDNPRFIKHPTYNGFYEWYGNIYLRPSLFIPIDKEEKFAEHKAGGGVTWLRDTSDEGYWNYLNDMEKSRVDTLYEVIYHEIGHWVHNLYFDNRGMYIRGRGGYARKNALENFACAFSSYMRECLGVNSKRYKRMNYILMEELKNTWRWKREHTGEV